MTPISAINPGMAGIQKGFANARVAAADIASSKQFNSDSPTTLAESLVDLKQAQIQIEASAKVVQAIDGSLGSLIDTFA